MSLESPQISEGWMRASDRDREATVAVLRDAFAAGRMDLAELRDRTAAVYHARTWGDLRKLTADLPSRREQQRWLGQLGAKATPGPAGRPRRPFALMGVMALAWLSIAAAAHLPAVAIPLLLLAMCALWAASWKADR